MSILVVTPIQGEIDWFLHSCAAQDIAAQTVLMGNLSAVRFPALDMIVALGGLGKTQFGVQTQHLLDQCDTVELMICAGAAGALSTELAIGDVVIGTETVEHDIRNHFGKPLLPRFPGDDSTVQGFRTLAESLNFPLHFGPIASGDEDVIDLARGRAIQQRTGALAVAWEGAGGARACRFNGVPFVEIRGITDNADHTAAADFAQNLQAALHNVATTVVRWALARKQ
ncbi:MAG: 5'-methylthioadenosine/S-adenosylhomocysteine nucleosidase [Caldilineaceae bacterium]|nr:5'-methylthioadenosine/S-adenosylhomocysteine nucleosidase [Caldilineaceae bacterium]